MQHNRLTHVELENQKGWNCQIYALAGVMRWIYQNGLINYKPLPVRKQCEEGATSSIRQLAKSLFHSAVGEMNNIYDIVELAKTHPELTASYITCNNAKEYMQMIVDAIDHNLAPIVYFEVCVMRGDKNGQPVAKTGDNDHSAVVVGYHRDEAGRLKFIITQWQQEFVVDALDLFKSSDQTRRNEISLFQKVFGSDYSRRAWIPANYVHLYFENPFVAANRDATRDIRQGFFRKSIVIVDSIHKIESFMGNLTRMIGELAKDNSKLAETRRKNLENLKDSLMHNDKRETLFKLVATWKKNTGELLEEQDTPMSSRAP